MLSLIRLTVYKELQQAMLSMNTQNEGYMLWLDHCKLPLETTLTQYLADRPQVLPRIPERFRRATRALQGDGDDEQPLTAKQVARQGSL